MLSYLFGGTPEEDNPDVLIYLPNTLSQVDVMKKTFEEVKQFFESKGWTLLETEYVKNSFPMKCICPNGHVGVKTYADLRANKRCSVCAHNKPLDYSAVKKAFEDRGYILLEKEYINSRTKMHGICPKGHEVYMDWNHFSHGGCSKCAGIAFGERRRNNI